MKIIINKELIINYYDNFIIIIFHLLDQSNAVSPLAD